jgi:hypothetical protein
MTWFKLPGWPETKAVVALAIIALFAAAYLHEPTDDTMKGALIAAFAGAWGYYLGSSKGASENREALNKALDKATTDPKG